MFLPTDHSKTRSALPVPCSFRALDWPVLASFWHPIAYASEVAERPVACRLLDVDLVAYRTATGITVARDRCAHRGTRLSLGWMESDLLVCPFHGLHYDGEGYCRRIPSLGRTDSRRTRRLRLETHRTVERYGLIWVCLAPEPCLPLPEWPRLEDEDLAQVVVPAGTWLTSAGRHVENFNDIAHLPWVHTDTFGGARDAPALDYEVERDGGMLRFEISYEERPDRIPGGGEGGLRQVRKSYELSLPFSTYLRVEEVARGRAFHFHDAACPVSADRTRVFQLIAHDYEELDEAFWLTDAQAVNEEDVPFVESQRPVEMPLDLREELHIPADKLSLEYRKALVSLGLGRP